MHNRLATELYIPRLFVSQASLEQDSDISPGKYTLGLGQTNMSVPSPCEDVASMALSALSLLLRKHSVSGKMVGRLEVGTETLVDKSKSIKTTLMALLDGNCDVEGVTSVNACYGGTAALFNSLAYLQSD